MNKETYEQLEKYMLQTMKDSAHDSQHVYRVLYLALEIAGTEERVDYDILIAACLLHDIGREKQFKNPKLCHAEEGSKMAYDFLVQNDWRKEQAEHIRDCIASHRFRNDNQPETIEARILFDADKLDVTGALGIARTLLYKGHINDPIYSVDSQGNVLDGNEKEPTSFFQEYQYKLKNIYDKFYTKRSIEMAVQRKEAAVEFYENIYDEVCNTYESGRGQLNKVLFD